MSEVTSNQEANKQSVDIERAKPADAQSILRLKQAAWLNAYVNEELGVTRDDIYKKLSDEDIAKAVPAWEEGLADEGIDSPQATYVARLNGNLVGYAAPRIEDGQCRIGALYILPEYQGQGIGRQLLATAVAWHGRGKDIYLHVVSYNDAAIEFYEKFGFLKTGNNTPEEYDSVNDIKLFPETEMILKA